jgi:hypothetical protein
VITTLTFILITSAMWVTRRELSRKHAAETITSMEPTMTLRTGHFGQAESAHGDPRLNAV